MTAPGAAPQEGVTLVAVGDVAFTGPLAADPLGLVERMDPAVRDLLRADIVLANLESILCDTIAPGRQGSGDLPHFAPTRAVEALRWLGVDVVSVANNHILDFGEEGLDATVRALDAAGIAWFGAGRWDQATRPCVLERKGLRIGFLGFGGIQVPTRRRPGCLPINSRAARRLIGQARQRCDRLVVYFHEGIEATSYPTRSTVDGCRRAAEAGADLIIGAHPHTIQGIEWYGKVPIAYSLGNFIMPMLVPERYEYWYNQTDLTELGIVFPKELVAKELILRCTLDRQGVRLEAGPAIMQESGVPRLPRPEEAPEEQAFFGRLCEAFEHPEDHVWRRRDEIESRHRRVQRGKIDWGFVVSRVHRLRWRHIAWYLKSFWRR